MGWGSAIGTIAGAFFGGPVGASIGGSLGGALDGSRDERKVREQQRENVALQREFAQTGIQWRVNDAIAAGVHPLFALGAGGAAFAPGAISVGREDTASQDVTRALLAQKTAEERALIASQIASAAAGQERDFAQASYYRALASKVREPASNAAPAGVVLNAYKDEAAGLLSHPLYQDAVKPEADPMVSRSGVFPGQTAGRGHPSLREFTMANGDKVLLPATQGGGVPEDIDLVLIPDIIGANIRRYGAKQAVLGTILRWFGFSLSESEANARRIRQEYERTGRLPGSVDILR